MLVRHVQKLIDLSDHRQLANGIAKKIVSPLTHASRMVFEIDLRTLTFHQKQKVEEGFHPMSVEAGVA